MADRRGRNATGSGYRRGGDEPYHRRGGAGGRFDDERHAPRVSAESMRALEDLLRAPAFYATGQPLQFADFVEIIGPHYDPQTAADRFEQYEEQYQSKQFEAFFEQHKDESWLLERYDPATAQPIADEYKTAVQKNFELFVQDLALNNFDDLTLDEPASHAAKHDGGAVDAMDVAAVVQNDTVNNDDDTHMDEDGQEIVEDGEDAAASKAISASSHAHTSILETFPVDTPFRTRLSPTTTTDDLRKPLPALLIKNVPQTVSRAMLIERLRDDPDFAYLSPCDPNASKRFSRTALVVLKEGANRDEALARLDGFKISVPVESGSTAAAAAATVAEPVAMEVPAGEAVESSATEPVAATTTPAAREIEFHLCISDKEIPTKVTSPAASDENRMRVDLQQARDLAKHFSDELGITTDPLAQIAPLSFERAPERAVIREAPLVDVKRSLDLYIVYLRRVFFFCYYCGKERFLTAEDLLRRCGSHHYRKKAAVEGGAARPGGDSARVAWKKRVDRVVDFYLDGLPAIALKEMGYQEPDVDLNNFVARNVQYVAPQKFRCRIPDCPKVFKGDEFVRKHIFNKHADRVEAYRRRAVLFNAYLKDPFKLSYVDVLEATHRQQRRVGGGSHTVSSAPRFMAPLTEIAGEFRAAMMGLDGRRQRGGSHPAEALMGGGRDRRPSYEDNGGRPNSATGPARQQVQYVDWDAPTGVVPLATAAASVVDELDYD